MLHLNDDVSASVACDYDDVDTSRRSREHSAFEDERQRRRTWIAWEGESRQESFMILKQWMEEWIISNKEDADV